VEEGDNFSVAASFGAVLLPDEANSPSEALRLADQRLYAQKRTVQSPEGRQTLDALLRVLFEREPALHGHMREVGELSRTIGERLGVGQSDLEQLAHAAELHDIGKLAIPDTILHKPGPLTPDELTYVRQHTLVGERILGAAPALAGVAALVRSSHERWDGGGYPEGLAGEDIPLGRESSPPATRSTPWSRIALIARRCHPTLPSTSCVAARERSSTPRS
jgi:two-component system cell cycle response regulator